MAKWKNAKSKRESGGYAPLAYSVSRSAAYRNLSGNAVKLINEFLAQYNGKNNGDFTIAWSLLKDRGWRSRTTIWRSVNELLEGGWIELSRQGGRHKASLYALTFYSVDECKGKLDIKSTSKPKGTWKIKKGGPLLKH